MVEMYILTGKLYICSVYHQWREDRDWMIVVL